MKRWQTFNIFEKVAVVLLAVGAMLGGILWMAMNAKASANRSQRAAAAVASPRVAASAAIEPVAAASPVKPGISVSTSKAALPAVPPSALPRACAQALRPAAVKDTAANISVDAKSTVRMLAAMDLVIPVAGVEKVALYDSFSDVRGKRMHEAIDIHAPRGTPVIAAGAGCVVKLFRSVPGGITLYQYDPEGNFAYYYAHLDRYADDVEEGAQLKRGDVIGYVGTTGNASPSAPHLHFAIYRLGPEKRWWVGTAVNPYAVFTYQ